MSYFLPVTAPAAPPRAEPAIVPTTVASNNLSALFITSLSVTASAISMLVSSCSLSVNPSDAADGTPTAIALPSLPFGNLFIAA